VSSLQRIEPSLLCALRDRSHANFPEPKMNTSSFIAISLSVILLSCAYGQFQAPPSYPECPSDLTCFDCTYRVANKIFKGCLASEMRGVSAPRVPRKTCFFWVHTSATLRSSAQPPEPWNFHPYILFYRSMEEMEEISDVRSLLFLLSGCNFVQHQEYKICFRSIQVL
jgi:hypothetical protein